MGAQIYAKKSNKSLSDGLLRGICECENAKITLGAHFSALCNARKRSFDRLCVPICYFKRHHRIVSSSSTNATVPSTQTPPSHRHKRHCPHGNPHLYKLAPWHDKRRNPKDALRPSHNLCHIRQPAPWVHSHLKCPTNNYHRWGDSPTL